MVPSLFCLFQFSLSAVIIVFTIQTFRDMLPQAYTILHLPLRPLQTYLDFLQNHYSIWWKKRNKSRTGERKGKGKYLVAQCELNRLCLPSEPFSSLIRLKYHLLSEALHDQI